MSKQAKKEPPAVNPLFAIRKPEEETIPLTADQIASAFAPDTDETEKPAQVTSLTEPAQLPTQEDAIPKQRRRTATPYHGRHKQFTSYIDTKLDPALAKLIEVLEESKYEVFNEAIYRLLVHYKDLLAEEGFAVESLPPYPRPRRQ